MNRFITYEPSTGKILGSFSGEEIDADTHMLNFPEGSAKIDVTGVPTPPDLKKAYVDITGEEPRVLPKIGLPLAVSKETVTADGVDEVVISGIPEGLEIQIDGIPYTITGGSLELSFSIPDTYLLTADQWPWLPWKKEIVAE